MKYNYILIIHKLVDNEYELLYAALQQKLLHRSVEMVPMNRRCVERYDFCLPVKLTPDTEECDEKQSTLMTKDIGIGGIFLETKAPLIPGSRVNMEITLPLDRLQSLRSKKMFINVPGEVIRCNKQGMALEFEDRYEYSSII